MIKVDNLSIGYNHKIIKENLSYDFESDVIYGILGESGIGKTTFLKTLSGLLKPIGGEIIRKIDVKDIYMMHQSYTCFNWLNCIDNLLITERIKYHKITKEIRLKALKSLSDVGLEEHAYKYPTQLSGGQRQRLALARTLFTSPKMILMDEPLSALDEETRTGMQDLILNIHKQTHNTIVMVTHSKVEANKMCDKILFF